MMWWYKLRLWFSKARASEFDERAWQYHLQAVYYEETIEELKKDIKPCGASQ